MIDHPEAGRAAPKLTGHRHRIRERVNTDHAGEPHEALRLFQPGAGFLAVLRA